MNKMNQKELLQHISEVSFMIDDITLYLDTHPECQEAMEEYCKYKNMRMSALHEYSEQYGALNRYQVNPDDYWCWVNRPWPWEKECGC